MVEWTIRDFSRINAPSAFLAVAEVLERAGKERFLAFRRLVSVERNLRALVDQVVRLGLTPLPHQVYADGIVPAEWRTVEEGGTVAGWTNAVRAEELAVVLESLKTSSCSWDNITPALIKRWEGFVEDARLRAGA
jgi:hypothetical protein